MSIAVTDAGSRKHSARRIVKRLIRRVLLPICVFVPVAYFFPKVAILYALCGAYDVGRNRRLKESTLRRYFIGNGVLTWVLSPLNALLDLLSLPYINKGVYRLEDLPPAYRDEVRRLIQAAQDADLVRQLEERSKDNQRTMIFFRWYGGNVDTFLNIPAFHQPWKYIQTIGVSVFNKKAVTSEHYGYVRASLRVLYNLNDMHDDSAYIVVGDHTNYWCKNKLFIFDDTLQHQSVNLTDQTRYCLFVDMIRPTLAPRLMAAVMTAIWFVTERFKFIYYKNWTVIR